MRLNGLLLLLAFLQRVLTQLPELREVEEGSGKISHYTKLPIVILFRLLFKWACLSALTKFLICVPRLRLHNSGSI